MPDRVNTIPTYDEMIRLAPELNKAEKGVNAIGMMCGRGFWATYTWQHVAAQYGLELFDDKWEPIFNGDAGVKGLETIVALSKHAIEGVAAADWPTNRAAWLGGQIACNISWQDSGTQATRPDQSKIGDDVLTIYEPRVEGGRFAPPNIAGSTSCVTATSPEPEAAFLMLAFLTTASIMAMNEANANGVAPGYKSVLTNEKLRAVSQPAKVWSEELDYCLVRAAPAKRLPDGPGNRLPDQQGGCRRNASRKRRSTKPQSRSRDHGKERLLQRHRSGVLCLDGARPVGWQGQETAVLNRNNAEMAGVTRPFFSFTIEAGHVNNSHDRRGAHITSSEADTGPPQPVHAQGIPLSPGGAGGHLSAGHHALSRHLCRLSQPDDRQVQARICWACRITASSWSTMPSGPA